MDLEIIVTEYSGTASANSAVYALIDGPITRLTEKLTDLTSSKLHLEDTRKMLSELKRNISRNIKEEVNSVHVIQVFNQHIRNLATNLKNRLDRIAAQEIKSTGRGRGSRNPGREKFLKSKPSVLASLEALEDLRVGVLEVVYARADFIPGAFPCSDWRKWKYMMPVQQLPSLKKYIEISAMLGAKKAEINKAAVAAAIEQITWSENVVWLKQCIRTSNNDGPDQFLTKNTGFSAERIDEDIIANYLDKDQAVFDVEIHVNNVWKRATLFFLGSSFEIMVEERVLVPGPRTAFKIETLDDPSTFILIYNDTSYRFVTYCPSLRDEIVLTVMAFMIKGPDKSKIRGQLALRFFPSMKKYSLAFSKLGTKKSEIYKEAVKAAIELTIRRENDLEPVKHIASHMYASAMRLDDEAEYFVADRIDVNAIADSLDDEDHVFDVEICVNGVWKSAKLQFPGNPFTIMVEGQALVFEPDLTTLWMETQDEPTYPPKFVLQLPYASYICRTHDASLRDEIVVMVKAFMIKSLFYTPKLVWRKPRKGWIKLNVEAVKCARMADGKDLWGIGGLIRDKSGNWLKGFWGNSDKEALIGDLELHSLEQGLIVAVEDEDCAQLMVEIEADSVYVVYMVLHGTDEQIENHKLVVDSCRKLLKRLGAYSLEAVATECNRAAYKLAKNGCQLFPNESFVSSREAPEDLKDILLKESC